MADDVNKDAITLYFDGMKADAASRGLTDPKILQFIDETEAAFRVRAQANPDFYKAINELVLYRKDAAKKLTNDILDIGKQAASGEIQALTGLETAKSQTVSLANATNIENEGLIQKSRAGWSAFWGNVADFFQDIPGCDFITDFCREREKRYAPKEVMADLAQNDAAKSTIGIDPLGQVIGFDNEGRAIRSSNGPIGRAMSTFSSALLTTDNERVGLGEKEVVAANARTHGMKEAVSKDAPAAISALPGAANNSSSHIAASQAGSVGNIEALAKDVVAKLSKDSKLDQSKVEALTRGIISADTLRGNKDGQLNANEGVTLHNNEAYKSLTTEQKIVLDKHLGIDAAGKPLAPAGPAPALH